jgi:hypothetical protein
MCLIRGNKIVKRARKFAGFATLPGCRRNDTMVWTAPEGDNSMGGFMLTRFTTAVLTVAFSVGLTVASTGAASAAPLDVHDHCRPLTGLDFYGTLVAIRPTPDTGGKARGYGKDGDCFAEDFETTGQAVWCPGSNSVIDHWGHGTDYRTKVTGYVNWCYLGVP